MTVHKSKGLEWPCVILCSLHKAPIDAKKTFFGVLTYNTEVETKLRLVPAAVKGFGIMDRFEDNNFFQEIKRATINEAKRLMYVGMTRPKEQLILTTYGTTNGDDWLTSIGCDSIDSHAAAEVINWGGADWIHSVSNDVTSEPEDMVTVKVTFDDECMMPCRPQFADGFLHRQGHACFFMMNVNQCAVYVKKYCFGHEKNLNL
jgi:ATP-dependent exoDNAse (exonuclease V) beta subunit